MDVILVAELVVLLSVANGVPVLSKRVFAGRFSQPIDGGLRFFDGRPLFGSTKTVRGVVAAVFLTAIAAPMVGVNANIGALIGIVAMAGDLASSFIKRRLDFAPSSRASGLDQIPESLFPLLACRDLLALTTIDILLATALFSIGSILLSPLLHRAGIRDRPF